MSYSDYVGVVWDKLQFGFDLVIPIVAIWAVLKWIREARKKSVNDITKASLIGNLNNLISSTSEHFVKNVVTACQAYEKRIDVHLKKHGNDKVALFNAYYSKPHDYLEVVGEYGERARKEIDAFYEITQISRYSIYPLLRVVGADQFIQAYEKETEEIIDIHNEILKSIQLVRFLAAMIEEKPDDNEVRDNFAKALIGLSAEMQKARTECKEVCSFLSALLEHIIASKDPDDFSGTLSHYRENILLCEKTIR